MRSRGIKKQIWLSREEDYLLKTKSEAAGLNASDLIRNLIVGYEPREKPPIEFYESIKQIRAVGNNLNQIAKYANAQGFVDGIHLRKEITKLNELIVDIKKEYLLPKETKTES